VCDLSLDIKPGEFTMVVGRSGSGKTTLLNLAGSLTRPTSGRVALDGVDLQNLSDQKRSYMRNRKIGFVFQFPSLMPTLTVLENVILPTGFTSDGHGSETMSGPKPCCAKSASPTSWLSIRASFPRDSSREWSLLGRLLTSLGCYWRMNLPAI